MENKNPKSRCDFGRCSNSVRLAFLVSFSVKPVRPIASFANLLQKPILAEAAENPACGCGGNAKQFLYILTLNVFSAA